MIDLKIRNNSSLTQRMKKRKEKKNIGEYFVFFFIPGKLNGIKGMFQTQGEER